MAVAILVGLWPDHAREIDPVRLGTVATAAMAWLAAEIASGRKPSEHDLSLFARIVELLPEATIDFLRDHDFDNSFAGNQQKGLFDIAAWEGSRREFLDRALQLRWAPIHADIKAFVSVLVAATGPVGSGPLFSAHPDHTDKMNPPDWVAQRIRELNEKAAALNKKADLFEHYARRRLRL
ncbi:MAG: hypothetical protein Q7T68_19870 [Sphingopyxis sp.]|nr:hypothetical protein [Sphingopyxis sp.]